MKKANKPIKEKEPAKKKVSLRPDPKAQKETKYVKKNFFTPDDDDEDEEDDLELPLEIEGSFDEEEVGFVEEAGFVEEVDFADEEDPEEETDF